MITIFSGLRRANLRKLGIWNYENTTLWEQHKIRTWSGIPNRS